MEAEASPHIVPNTRNKLIRFTPSPWPQCTGLSPYLPPLLQERIQLPPKKRAKCWQKRRKVTCLTSVVWGNKSGSVSWLCVTKDKCAHYEIHNRKCGTRTPGLAVQNDLFPFKSIFVYNCPCVILYWALLKHPASFTSYGPVDVAPFSPVDSTPSSTSQWTGWSRVFTKGKMLSMSTEGREKSFTRNSF
jgi:hypothetical protein